jgi:hypothetical protein
MPTTLAADISATDTSLTLNTGHDAVATGDTLTIEMEKVKVTGGSGDTFTIARGQQATTAAAHVSGTAVAVTKASICSQIAVDPTVTPAGFVPVPSHVYLGTCNDASSEPTWQEISNVESLTIPSPSISMLDVNNLANASKVVLQIPGLSTPGDIALVVNYWPDDPTHNELTGLIHLSKTREVRPFKIETEYTAGETLVVTFAAFVTALPLAFTGTGAMKLNCTLRQFGDVTVERTGAPDTRTGRRQAGDTTLERVA